MTRKYIATSLVEMLVTISLVMAASILMFGISIRELSRSTMRDSVSELYSSLSLAQQNAKSGKNSSSYGVKVEPSKIIYFEGDSEATGINKEIYSLPSTVTATVHTSNEVVFTPNSVKPTTEARFTISEGSEIIDIRVNSYGMIDIY